MTLMPLVERSENGSCLTLIHLLACFFLIAAMDAIAPALAQSVGLDGGITVTLQPPEAVADGAGWSVNGGSERASGAQQSGVVPGHHTIQFRDLAAWQEPEAVDILVIGGKQAALTATYRRLPSFYFQAVPEQHARPGKALEFLVQANDPGDPQSPSAGTPLILTAIPQPAGAIAFDDTTGHFRYTPAVTDRLPFALRFATAQGLVGTTTITPLNQLAAEDTVIEYDRPLPNPASRDYISITEKTNVARLMNDAMRETLSVEISGHTLVFQAGHEARLFEAYNGRHNLEAIHLYADRIIIGSPLILPQTRVTIHARELRFENGGLINTTPQPRALVPAGAIWEDNLTQGNPGDPGHDAGHIDVFVEHFHSDPSTATRFILRGGKGGAAGDGRDGRAETTVSFLSADWNKLMARAGNPVCGTVGGSSVIRYREERFNNELTDTCGSKGTARGENAVRSGRPGNGGAGGILRSTLNLAPFAELSGGVAGAKGRDHAGGTLSARKFIYQFVRTTFRNGEEIVNTSSSDAPKAAGSGAVAPDASIPVGAAGNVIVVTNSGAWLHSFAIRSVVQFVKDAYLNGRLTEARRLLEDYRQLILAYQPVVPPGTELSDAEFLEKVNLDQLLAETETLLHRLQSNLDYFGNPAGWVPMLSFEANLLAFANEVEQSIPVLYLAYWLNNAATNLQASLGAAVQAKASLEDELDRMITAFNEAQVAIPRLKVEADAINFRIGIVKGQLTSKLAELLERARQNVAERHKVSFWKKAAGVLAVAADLVPIGQPTVGRIGSGLGLLSQFDPEKPLESAATLTPKAFELFSEKNITVCFGGTNNAANPTNAPSSGTNAVKKAKQDKLAALTECGKFLGAELKELSNVFKEVQVDSAELEAELEKLKASDAEFKGLTQQVIDLSKQKEEFALQLAAALQTVAAFSGAMTENLIATHQIESRLEDGFAALDHGALLHIKEMERRAKDRLLQYQYFLAKSFQYRRLKPYSGNLQLTRLFTRFQVLVENGNPHVLSAQEFEHLKSLFTDELREIVAQMFDNFNAPELSLPISFRLTSAELEQLNTDGQLVINLKERGLLGNTRENVRIADFRAKGMSVHPVSGQFGTHALVGVNFEHLGNSRLSSGGRTFLFRHYQTEAVNPIVWNAVFDGLRGTLQNSELSTAQQSLIAVLLNVQQSNDPSLVFFSRPAAWADILITKEVSTDNGIDVAIDDLHIEVQYDFYNTSGNERELAVEVNDDLSPLIVVSQRDINGRQDGQGDFLRVFSPFSQVTLQAPPSYGQFVFDRWMLNGQPAPAGEATLLVNLVANTKAEARFRSAPVSLDVPDLSPVIAPAGQVGFRFQSNNGTRYVLERTERLVNPVWLQVDTRTGDGTLLQFTRPTGTNAASFFRLRVD